MTSLKTVFVDKNTMAGDPQRGPSVRQSNGGLSRDKYMKSEAAKLGFLRPSLVIVPGAAQISSAHLEFAGAGPVPEVRRHRFPPDFPTETFGFASRLQSSRSAWLSSPRAHCQGSM